jgi:hypothetical protein
MITNQNAETKLFIRIRPKTNTSSPHTKFRTIRKILKADINCFGPLTELAKGANGDVFQLRCQTTSCARFVRVKCLST